MTNNIRLTEAQAIEFWELCGWENCPSGIEGTPIKWRFGFEERVKLPPINTKNLIKYIGTKKIRIYKGDKWTKIYGSQIPIGTLVNVVKFCPRRTVIVEYKGKKIITKLWCLKKLIPMS